VYQVLHNLTTKTGHWIWAEMELVE